MKTIDRHNLNQLLDKGLSYPLVLIVAAAGSGKSTCLEQWIDYRRTSIDPDSKIIHFEAMEKLNEGDRLFEHIFKALSAITPLWEGSFFKLFKTDQEADPETLVDIFIQCFQNITSPLTIVIDDFHLIKTQRIMNIINHLIRRFPKHITLILSSRSYPDFSVSRLKLEEQVLVIDSHDLSLDRTELSQLSYLLCDSKIGEEQLNLLLKQTEGWFVGIKLALLAFSEQGEKALKNFSGKQPELLNYFGHEIVNHLPEHLKTSLLSCAICPRLNQTLCDALYSSNQQAISLKHLHLHELLISNDPERPDWYRFHPLLKDFLYQKLESETGIQHIQSLHLKAAESLCTQNLMSEAIYHARLSDRKDIYIDILSNATESWLKRGEFEPVIDSLSAFTETEFKAHTGLHIHLIYALTFSRRFNQAGYHLSRLKQLSLSHAEMETTRFLKVLISLFQSDSELQDLNLPPNRITEHTPTDVTGFYLIMEAYNCMYNGRLNEAFRLASQAKQLLQSISHDFFLGYANLILILCDRYLGRGIDALNLINNVYAPIRHAPKTSLWIYLSSAMVVVNYEQNKLEDALAMGEQLMPLVIHSSITEVIMNAYLYSARIHHIQGQKNKARRVLEQLDRILASGDYQRFESQVLHEKMRQAVQDTLPDRTESLFSTHDLADVLKKGVWRADNLRYEEHRERRALASVYALIAKEKYDQATRILNQLADLLDKQNLPMRALVARCNLAMIAYHERKHDAAIRQLLKLVHRYGLVCFSRTVFDEAPGLETLFQKAISKGDIDVPAMFSDIFSDLFELSVRATSCIQSYRLTDKESEILSLLANGLSNAEISKQADIAISTTKWHLKNIYSKLEVENRSAALLIAHKALSD